MATGKRPGGTNTFGIRVIGIQDVQKKFKKLGLTAKRSRTEINKALRPAGTKLARGMQQAYKDEFNRSKRKRKSGRVPTYKTIGVVTARKSREPGLFVGPIKRRATPIRVHGKNSYNLAEMQIVGNKFQDPRKDIFVATAIKMEGVVLLQAEKDLDRLVEKMIKQAGL